MKTARRMSALFAVTALMLGACGGDDGEEDSGGGTLGPQCQKYEACCEELAADNGAMADACVQAMDQNKKALAQNPGQKESLESSCGQALSAARSAGYCGTGGTGGGDPNSCTTPAVRGPAESCCLAYGLDACGAGLFCAAFDGRVESTCYVERSRLDGQECTADVQCLSNSCNTATSRCRALLGSACDTATGCAPSETSEVRIICVEDKCVKSSGENNSPCNVASDCASMLCREDVCMTVELGSQCASNANCTTSICYQNACVPGYGGDPCDNDSHCLSNSCGRQCVNAYGVATGVACQSEAECHAAGMPYAYCDNRCN